MKQYLSYLGASLAAIAALASCNKELGAPVEDLKGGVPFEISASAVDTKTSIDGFTTSWVANDAINLFHAEARSTTNYTSDGEFKITAETLAENKFKGTLASALTAESYDWYAFYPYSKYNITPAGSSQSDFGFTTIGGTSQTQTGNNSTAHLCGKPCPLYGIATAVASDVAPSIVMNHLASIVEVNVTNNSGEDLTVTSVSFTGTEDIVGTYYIDFTKTPIVYKPRGDKYVSSTASLSVSDGEAIVAGSSAMFYIAIKPFTVSSGALKVAVNGYEKEIPISKETVFTAGKIKKINFNYDNTAVVKSVTFDFSDPESLGLTKPSTSAATNITSDIVVGDVTLTTTNGGTATRIWNSKGTCDLRVYKSGGSLSFSVPDGSVITRIVFAGDAASSGYSASVGTLKSGTWTGSNQNVKFTATNNLEISTAVVTYSAGKANTSIISDDITGISARGESTAESSYTIENPIDGKTISATCDGNVVTAVTVDAGTILYDVAANTTKSAREGSITLTYGDVTKVVKVSQLAPVFKVSRTEVELEAAANSSSTITVTSDFDWMSEASTNAGFTYDPTVCEWTTENPYTDGKTTVTITASAENASEEGTKTLGTLTFTNKETSEKLVVTVTQKTSYSTGKTVTFTFDQGQGNSKETLTWTDNTITLTASKGKGSNNPNEHAKDKQLRFYAKNTLTVSGATIKKITFNVGTWQDLTVTAGSISNKVWTPNDKTVTSVTFTNNQSKQATYNSITIEYE
ncbi:MAG: hypothetical protein SPG52_00365 [Candidatus Cryptobacteroides sp.]|nr:hypothetical protein [Candidatus Cryptobacteroides sp.]